MGTFIFNMSSRQRPNGENSAGVLREVGQVADAKIQDGKTPSKFLSLDMNGQEILLIDMTGANIGFLRPIFLTLLDKEIVLKQWRLPSRNRPYLEISRAITCDRFPRLKDSIVMLSDILAGTVEVKVGFEHEDGRPEEWTAATQSKR